MDDDRESGSKAARSVPLFARTRSPSAAVHSDLHGARWANMTLLRRREIARRPTARLCWIPFARRRRSGTVTFKYQLIDGRVIETTLTYLITWSPAGRSPRRRLRGWPPPSRDRQWRVRAAGARASHQIARGSSPWPPTSSFVLSDGPAASDSADATTANRSAISSAQRHAQHLSAP